MHSVIGNALGALAAVLALSALPGCGSSSDSPATNTGTLATFSEIYDQIFPTTTNPRCNFCHSMPAANTSNGSLHMGSDKDTAHAALVGQASRSDKCGGKTLVVAGDPTQSLFLQKLSPNPPCGDRMPLGGAPLSTEQLQLITSWIAGGALND